MYFRKLFEWEESRGIAPESSTIALLNNPDVESTEDSKKTNPNVGALKKDGLQLFKLQICIRYS